MSQPWMPFYVGDYLRDTRSLNTVGHGAYLLLIMEYWTHGGLPDDDEALARIVLVSDKDWARIKPLVARFFTMPGWKHSRIDRELQRVKEAYERRSRAGRSGGIAKANGRQRPSIATSELKQ